MNLITNIRLGCKGLPRTNTLAYLISPLIANKEKFNYKCQDYKTCLSLKVGPNRLDKEKSFTEIPPSIKTFLLKMTMGKWTIKSVCPLIIFHPGPIFVRVEHCKVTTLPSYHKISYQGQIILLLSLPTVSDEEKKVLKHLTPGTNVIKLFVCDLRIFVLS